jgi:branched-subunit amino acid aminotransferase/4-amino-4-deoxychorismate lyase
MNPLAYLHGQFLDQDQARLPLNDAGFVWGATVTDLCRTFRHRLFRLDDHLARFRTSCRLARVPLSATDAELTAIADRLVAHNAALIGAEDDLALVTFATPGPIGYYLGEAGQGPPTLGLHTFPLPFARYRRLFQEGARLVIPSVRHPSPSCVDPRIKQRSRLFWWLAEQQAHDSDPNASALLLDEAGHLTETAAANLLLVRQGGLLTPRRERVLSGISLRMVEELCAEMGIPFAEADLTRADILSAEEALLANTAYCLAPVKQIDGRELPCPGPVFWRLLDAWRDHVGVDIRVQILAGRGPG